MSTPGPSAEWHRYAESSSPVAQVCNAAYTVVGKLTKTYLPAEPVYRNVHAELADKAASYQTERS